MELEDGLVVEGDRVELTVADARLREASEHARFARPVGRAMRRQGGRVAVPGFR